MMRLTDLSEEVASGRTSPSALLRRCLARIDERESEVRAWAFVAASSARQEAAALDRELKNSGPRSPLHGIPVGVKDIFDVAGMPCEWGSAVEQGRTPSIDAALVTRLRALGAVILGKTHTTAYAYFDPAPTRNPCDLDHTPGGSSSGSAAAVADGMVPLAVGSQTMGSVLRPASFCGVVGWKPTFGSLPLDGVMPFAPSLDHAGLFTSDVAGMQLAWRVLTGGSPAITPKPAELIAWPWPIERSPEPAMAAAMEASLDALQSAGWRVRCSPLPEAFVGLQRALLTVMTAEGARTHGEAYQRHGDKIGVKLAALIAQEADIAQAKAVVVRAKAAFLEAVAPGSIVVTPAALGPAPQGLASTGDPCCNAPWTALGVPAINVPGATTPEGLPLGLQLVAGPGAETDLLACALACESVIGSN
jgi:Asp-tRNA(Asn)/Glu-tRNA(Gln) amidotransferase A subunit family amidase